MKPDELIIKKTVKDALREDLGCGDITTNGTIAKNEPAKGIIYVQADGVVAGLDFVREVFKQLDAKQLFFKACVKDGQHVKNGQRLCSVVGPARVLLTGERTALNFLGLMSGIATKTATFVAMVKGTRTKILDTRKTIPGLRYISKYAVKAGGGYNHRMGLYDAVLIKDNHIMHAGSITRAIEGIRKKYHDQPVIEVETETIAQVKEALGCKADIILLDNFKLAGLKKAIALIGKKAESEISGNVTLATMKKYSQLGVDRISVGALTHSASWLPVHMEFE